MSIPTDSQVYVLATSVMAAFFVAAIIRLWLLRSVEEKLLKNKEALEKQVVLQQKDLLTVRQDANAWRTEMQRQFDLYRHMASDQLGVEEKRFNDLLSKSTRREYELQTALDLAKGMCAELPGVKARVLQLEALLEAAITAKSTKPDRGSGGGLPAVVTPVSPMPDLGGGGTPAPVLVPEPAPVTNGFLSTETPAPSPTPLPIKFAPRAPAPSPFVQPPAPTPVEPEKPVIVDDSKVIALEQKLAEMEKKNAFLQLTLTTTRLRTRSRPSSLRKVALKKQRA